MGLGDVPGLAHLTAGGVWHLAVTDLLGHGASRVRHLLGPLLARPAASGVRHLAADRLAGPATGGVRHLLGAAFTSVGTGGVRHLLLAGLTGPAASRVGHLLGVAVRNAAAGGVRHLAVLHFAHPVSAADLASDRLRAPDLLAAHARWALDLLNMAAAGLVDAAASTFIPAERARGADAAVDDWTGNAFLDHLPFAALDVLTTSGGDGTANSVTDIAVASLSLGAVCGAGNRVVAGLVVWLANRVALGAVARLVAGSADAVADVSVASLVVRLTDLATNRAVTCLVARLANRVAAGAVAGLVARFADRVALIPPAGVVDRAIALDRNLGVAGVHHRLAFLIRLGTPSRLMHSLVATTVTGASLAVVLTRFAARCRAAPVAAHPAEESGF